MKITTLGQDAWLVPKESHCAISARDQPTATTNMLFFSQPTAEVISKSITSSRSMEAQFSVNSVGWCQRKVSTPSIGDHLSHLLTCFSFSNPVATLGHKSIRRSQRESLPFVINRLSISPSSRCFPFHIISS